MPHPCDHRCDHEENRRKICAPCGRKINLGDKKLEYFEITKVWEKLIQQFIDSRFSTLNPKYPLSVCCNCRKILAEHRDRDPDNDRVTVRSFKTMPNYDDICLPPSTRTSDESQICQCYICLTGRHKRRVDLKNKLRVGESLNLSSRIHPGNGQFGTKNSKVTKLPKIVKKKEKKAKTLCALCYKEIGRGISHKCIKSAREKRRLAGNVLDITDTLAEKQKEQICSELIKQTQKKLVLSIGGKVDCLTVSTGGPKRKLYFNKPVEQVRFSPESLNTYQVHSGSSGQQMKQLATFIRGTAGRKSIPANFSKQIAERANILKDFYKYDMFDFDVEKSDIPQKRPVVWCNSEEILEEVIVKRSLVGDYVIKIMADGGQGFFKVCMTILPGNYVSDPDSASDSTQAKRMKFDKLTSVHKLIMLGIVPQIKESYENVKKLFDLIQINDIPFKFVSDFKLLLIINGQQTATATFPCPYCFVTLKQLKTRDELERDEQNLTLKTYGDLRKDYGEFISRGGNKKLAKSSHSTVNLPLFNERDDMSVIEKCVMPELHILQGLVNHIFWTGLVPLLGKEKALTWPRHLNLISKNYHGDSFEGNACRKMLKEPDFLLSNEVCGHIGQLPVVPYVSALRALDKIVHNCFSNTRLDGELHKWIGDFKKSLSVTDVTETLKVHVCLKHLEQSLEFLEREEGFGVWSEQAGESIHREFLKFWNRRKLNNIMDPNYPVKLKDAVVDFSSKHI